MSDLQKQVAAMPCPGDGTHEESAICLPGQCSLCQGTGLRWPELSFSSRGGNPNYERVPDVTLEKVLDCLEAEGYDQATFVVLTQYYWPDQKYRLYVLSPLAASLHGYGPTRELAACAALLASQSVPELQQPVTEAIRRERHASHDARDQQSPDGVRHSSPEPE